MKDKLTRTGSIAVMALLGVLATVGVGYATIPSNNVISSCYSKSGGTLRVIDATTGSCGSKETSLNWNVQGPKGEPGPQGPKGDPGPQGSAGTSQAFIGQRSQILTVSGSARTPVVEKALPPGRYLMSAKVEMFNDNGDTDEIFECDLVAAWLGSDVEHHVDSTMRTELAPRGEPAGDTVFVLMGDAHIGDGMTGRVTCDGDDADDEATVSRAVITATKFDSIE